MVANDNRRLKKTIIQMDKYGNKLREISRYNQCEELGLTYWRVWNTIKKNQKTHKGYVFCYKEDFEIESSKLKLRKIDYILKLNIDGKVINKYENLKSTEYDGHNIQGVSKALNGSYTNHNGYLWIKESKYNENNVKELIDKYMNAEDERVSKMLKTKYSRIKN